MLDTIGATARVAKAVTDALAPLAINVAELPLSAQNVATFVAAAAVAHTR